MPSEDFESIGAGVIFRRLFAALLTLTMIFAPLAIPAMAEAATPASHHGAMAGKGHCNGQSTPDQRHKAADNSCCAAMCVAVVVPADVAELPKYHASRQQPASDIDRRGFIGEIATPPPRPA